MKFIHFADAHLDSPFRGLSFLPSQAFQEIYEAAAQSLQHICNLALREQVDLVLIAGDTFDSNQPSPHSQLFFAQQIKRLTQAHIQVVMIFGNHDHMAKDELLVPPSPYFKLLGPNERVETAHFKTRNGFPYQVTGFSYLHNHISKDMLAAFPAKGHDYSFALMHAQEKSTAREQNVYAPFSLAAMRNLNYDYFALGHIHLRQVLSRSPLIVYPGNIQGRQIGEMGAKGCYLGSIDEESKKTNIVFKPTAAILWQQEKLQLGGPLAKTALQEQILQQLAGLKQKTYVSLLIAGAQFLTEAERELVGDPAFWQSLKLPYSSQLVDVRLKTSHQLILNNSDQTSFLRAEKEVFAPAAFAQTVHDWQQKDAVTERWAQDPQFRQAVKDLAQLKLMNELKGIDDAADKD